MTIHEKRLIYAGESSDTYNVMLCSIGALNTSTNDEASDIITSKSPFKNEWNFHHLNYNSPLQFSITIAKIKPSGEYGEYGEYFDSREQRNIKKWLCKSKRHWLQIDQPDLGQVFYYCIITNPRPYSVGMLNAGWQFDVTCDSICAWSDLKQQSFSITDTSSFDIYNDFDYDEYILYPTLTITPTIGGNITITNNTTLQVVSLTSCIANEEIIMDCKNDKIKSSNGRVLIDNWNKEFLEIINGVNNLTIIGNCTLLIEYRLPIRVGG